MNRNKGCEHVKHTDFTIVGEVDILTKDKEGKLGEGSCSSPVGHAPT